MQRKVLLILGLVLIAGSTYAHGVWTLRWRGTRDLEAAAASVDAIPNEFGDWTSEDLEVSKRTMDQAGAVGYLSRRYDNKNTGQSVLVMLLCGRTGPLAAHLPTICLPGSGMELVSGEKSYTMSKRDQSRDWGKFAWADFKGLVGGNPMRTRLFWSWSPDGSNWDAPSHPRVALAGYPHLYKIFVHREIDPSESKRSSHEDDPCVIFLREFLEEIKKAARETARNQ